METVIVHPLELGQTLSGIDLDRVGGCRTQDETVGRFLENRLTIQAILGAKFFGDRERPTLVDLDHGAHSFSNTALQSCGNAELRRRIR